MFCVIQLFVFVVHRTIRIRPNSVKPLFGASLVVVIPAAIVVMCVSVVFIRWMQITSYGPALLPNLHRLHTTRSQTCDPPSPSAFTSAAVCVTAPQLVLCPHPTQRAEPMTIIVTITCRLSTSPAVSEVPIV